jgi:uncharacterized small protein (DUF1192 family)
MEKGTNRMSVNNEQKKKPSECHTLAEIDDIIAELEAGMAELTKEVERLEESLNDRDSILRSKRFIP